MQTPANIVVLPGKFQDSGIETDIPHREMASLIEAGNIVVLPKLFDPAAMLALRQAVVDWSNRTPPFPRDRSASIPCLNFHRRDDDSPSWLAHRFHQYAFGDWDAVDPGLSGMLQSVCRPLLALQNALAGTDFNLSTPSLRCKLINHPAGGGYLVKHVHPYRPQKVAFFLSLSRYGQDFETGGAVFDTPGKTVTLTELFDIGNVVLFRYDLPHEVPPIDPLRPLDWSSPAGLWMLSVELVESYPNSRPV
ncbi:MAG: hypothetical protein HY942_08705 [Gammaproteobacteria bacterium]|nr:hypothetical protein [Gammaproteobacteria bacterium]